MIAERDIARQLVRFARALGERDWATLRDILFDDATAGFDGTPVATHLVAAERS
jgi:hypothetical protein